MEKKLELGQEILKKMEEAASAEILAYKNAKKRTENLEVKKGDYLTEIESLKKELKRTFQDVNNIKQEILARRDIQKKLDDDEEILIAINQRFLPAAKKEWQDAGEKIMGIFYTVLPAIKQPYQKKLNQIFEDAGVIIQSLELEMPVALRALLGDDLSSFSTPGYLAVLRKFDMDLAPEDPLKLSMARASVFAAISSQKT